MSTITNCPEQYKELIDKYRPILKFHPDEQYWLSSIDYYLENATIGMNGLTLSKKVTKENLCSWQNSIGLPLYLTPNKDALHGQKNDLNDVPIYVSVRETRSQIIIHYIFFYVYNGAFMVCGYPNGQHNADLENFAVYINKRSCELDKVFYSAHKSQDGVWLKNSFTGSSDNYVSNIPMENGHPVVYIANHSHACYPKAKTYWRIFGFANDHTSDMGFHWLPNKLVYIDDNTNWNKFEGYWGAPDHVPSPKYHDFWTHDPIKSTNCFKRLFCFCW